MKGVCFLTSCGLSGESGLAVTAVADIKGNNAKKNADGFCFIRRHNGDCDI